jgi:transposase
MPFAALDLHQQHTEAVVLGDDGSILHRQRLATTRAALTTFARQHLGPTTPVAVEATFNTWPIVDLLTPLTRQVVVSNPLRTRAIAEARIKTDKVDALVLAQLLRLDFLPRVWIPDAATQQLRRATTERTQLTSDRTRIKNRIHALLHQRLIAAPEGDLFTPGNLLWLRTLELDSFGRAALDRQLRLLDQVQLEISQVNDALAAHAYRSPAVKLLMTLPGVDFAVAETVLAALGDVTRFPSSDRAAAYLGLVPSTRQSGQHCYHGSITKQGSGHARWMLVQAAQQLGKNPGPLGVFFRKLAKRKNRNVAVVATARKLVVIAWHMLRNDEPYRYSIPQTTQAKLDRLRIRATGERKKGGNPKGAPRPATYGSGKPTRAIPSLDRIYESNSLPALSKMKPGELAMLERNQLTGLEADLHKPRRVPKGVKGKAAPAE